MFVRYWARTGAASVVGLALAALVPTHPALAAPRTLAPQNNAWMACDGYGMPTKSGDGMTEYANTLLIFNLPGMGTTDRKQQARGAEAVDFCSQAVTSTPKAHWRRRFNLLQARGLHRLESADNAGVLEDFDQAQALAPAGDDDLMFRRSQGLGLDIARAYALRRLGQTADGRALALKTVDARPYARSPLMATLLALGPTPENADYDKVSHALARLSPTLRGALYLDALEQGDFATAIALRPYLSAPKSSDRMNQDPVMQAIQDVRLWAAQETFWTEADGSYAYALAASGRPAEARATLAAAKSRVETAKPPLPSSPKPKYDIARQSAATSREKTLNENQATLALWTKLVERRILVAEGKADVVAKSLDGDPLPPNGGGADLLSALAAATPGDNREIIKSVATLRARLRARLRTNDNDYPDSLFGLLPEAEITGRLTPWRENKFSLIAGDYGYSQNVETDGKVKIRARGLLSSGAMVEEMALLRAAQLALAGGHHGFVVLDRSDVDWTTVSYYMGMPSREDPGGFETTIVVRFIDPKTTDAPPWLILDADAVRAALEPIYTKTAATEVAGKQGAP